MSRRREKKVRKIKAVRIVPSIIGQTLFSLVFIVALCAVFDAWISGLEQQNCIEAYRHAEQAYNAFSGEASQSGENSQLYETITAAIPEVRGIAVGGTDESYGQRLPASFTDLPEVTLPFIREDDPSAPEAVRLDSGSAEPGEAAEFIDDGELSGFFFSENITPAFASAVVGSVFSDSFNDVLAEEFPVFGLWFEFGGEERSVFVNTDVAVKFTDFFYFVICAAAFAIFFLLLFIYRLFSLLSMLSEKKRFRDALYLDDTTGERNWDYFKKQAEHVIKRSGRKKTRLAMVHLRTEKYRSFCTCFGVKEGQELVEQLFREIKRSLGRNEHAARYERADFALLLQYTDPAELESRIEKLMQRLDKVRLDRKLYFNAGICAADDPKEAPETLYSSACTARDTIDDDSGDCIAWFSDELQKLRLWEHTVESDAQRAIDNHEFALYLQPKYSTRGERLSAAEALVRWIHPTEGVIPPGRFIPIFETNGFITKLDDYMLREIASVTAKWLAEGKTPVPVSVNISRANFTRSDLAEHILGIVDEYGVPHRYIELELTESAFFDDKRALINTVSRLREYGFPVSMDDFGTGFSSLNSLKEIPLDTVKLDAEFFRGGDSSRGMLIIEKTIGLAKELGMSIVAEGIETREQVDFLAENDCDLIQGFYFAKPMPVSEFEEKAFSPEKAPESAENPESDV